MACLIYSIIGTQEEAAHAYDIAAIEYRGINAVTNFDLSTYIRWLRPGANPLASQEPTSSTVPLTHPVLTSSNLIPIKEITQNHVFHSNPFTVNDLDTSKQHDIFQTQPPLSPCTKSSSPTALGLLLKSSIFRQLVEKNSNAENEESGENGAKRNLNLPLLKNKEANMVSFEVIDNMNYSTSSANAKALPGLEPQEEKTTLPLCNGKWQSLWNNTFNLSSSIPFNEQ